MTYTWPWHVTNSRWVDYDEEQTPLKSTWQMGKWERKTIKTTWWVKSQGFALTITKTCWQLCINIDCCHMSQNAWICRTVTGNRGWGWWRGRGGRGRGRGVGGTYCQHCVCAVTCLRITEFAQLKVGVCGRGWGLWVNITLFQHHQEWRMKWHGSESLT